MPHQFLSVPTLFKGRFRMVEKGALQLWTSAGGGESAFRQDALALARQDAVMRFLVELDRKLDTVLSLLRRDSLEADFPYEGYVLELSASGLLLESREALSPGQHMELLLMLGGYPQRIVSVMAVAEAESPDGPRVEPQSKRYVVSHNAMSEEDREVIIAFVFQEDRKRIRRQKEETQEDAPGR